MASVKLARCLAAWQCGQSRPSAGRVQLLIRCVQLLLVVDNVCILNSEAMP